MSKTYLITGASRGFGRLWAEAFLNRGDKVAATARDVKSLEDLSEKYGDAVLTIQLDVCRKDECFDAIKKAYDHFGAIDTVINNAGYTLFGTVEETNELQAREQMETNFFGSVWVTQAAIPLMREQGHGHIIQVSSLLGLVGMPTLSLYNASKFAIEGFSEALSAEVNGFGINITMLEPNGYATENLETGVFAQGLDHYKKLKEDFYSSIAARDRQNCYGINSSVRDD